MPFEKGHPFYKGGEKGWFKKGHIPWDKNKKLSKEHIEKLRQSKLRNPVRYWLGKKRSPEIIEILTKNGRKGKGKQKVERIKIICQFCKKQFKLLPCHTKRGRKFCSNDCFKKSKPFTGIKNPNWKGGLTPIMRKTRNCSKYNQWRLDIFTRDNFKCIICNKRGGHLEADHYPKMFSTIFYENKLKTFKDALNCEKLWNTNNGRTLCKQCHNNTKLSNQFLKDRNEKVDN